MGTRREYLKKLLTLPFIGPFIWKGLWAKSTDREILLNKFSVAGFRFYNGPNLLEKMRPGEPLTLKAEPDNEYDNYAVKIYYQNEHIGYVPRSDNKPIFRLLQQNIPLMARITQIQPDQVPWQMVQVKIWLIVPK